MRWHLITGEYPPQPGGVSDYTHLVAREIRDRGHEVHIWAPRDSRSSAAETGIILHRLPDWFGPRGLRFLGAGLRELQGQIIVQYVPHMYGYKAMNIGFALWLRFRAPRYSIMFHEVAYPVESGQRFRYRALGHVNRIMAGLAANGAEQVFISVPHWLDLLRMHCGFRGKATWLPVPSNVATSAHPDAVRRIRESLLGSDSAALIGHFGTFDKRMRDSIGGVFCNLLRRHKERRALLIGRGSESFSHWLTETAPDVGDRLTARDDLTSCGVAEHIAACDLMVQPYFDGVSSRRGSVMAALALGLPIVTNESSSSEPVWREERLVAAVPERDPETMAAAAERLMADPAERAALGDRARCGYDAHFSIRRTIAALRAANE